MPLLNREPFVKVRPPPNIQKDDEVFYCKLTDEVFVDYDEFFERTILCNSLVWTCCLTGECGTVDDLEAYAWKRALSSFIDEFIDLFIHSLITNSSSIFPRQTRPDLWRGVRK